MRPRSRCGAPITNPTPPLARQLRDATRDAHRALDHHPALRCLLAPTLTREAYAHFLHHLDTRFRA